MEQLWFRLFLDHQRQLPRQVVGVLQTRVHPLGADGTMDMRRVAEHKAAPVPETNRSPMMDAIGRKPTATLDVEILAGVFVQDGDDFIELQVRFIAQFRWKNRN